LIVTELGAEKGSEPRADDFARALHELHALIGLELSIDLWVRDHFFAVDFIAKLDRVETVPGGESVMIHFDNGVKIDLAPREQALLGAGGTLTFGLGEEMVLELRPASASSV
jgi:hypothetical protein